MMQDPQTTNKGEPSGLEEREEEAATTAQQELLLWERSLLTEEQSQCQSNGAKAVSSRYPSPTDLLSCVPVSYWCLLVAKSNRKPVGNTAIKATEPTIHPLTQQIPVGLGRYQ